MWASTHLKGDAVPFQSFQSQVVLQKLKIFEWQMLLLLGLDSVLLMCFKVVCMYGRKVTEVGFPLDPVVMSGLRD
jgi:hypothetical protein